MLMEKRSFDQSVHDENRPKPIQSPCRTSDAIHQLEPERGLTVLFELKERTLGRSPGALRVTVDCSLIRVVDSPLLR